METLSEDIKTWLSMSNDDHEHARSFYFEHILPQAIESFICQSKDVIEGKHYDHIISVLGMSPEPAIFLHRLINPKKHYFICTPQSEESLDLIASTIELRPRQYEKIVLEDSSTTEIYRSIKKIHFKNPQLNALMDITGGKKSMSSAASLAGSFIGMDIAYVDYHNYSKEHRKPIPLTEYMVILENPYAELGDLKIGKAIELFNAYQFDSVCKTISDEIRLVRDKSFHVFLAKLSNSFRAWDQFDFPLAFKELDLLIHPNSVSDSLSDCPLFNYLKNNLNTLDDLIKKPMGSIEHLINFYASAKRMEENGRYDIGVFLLYRVLEGIAQLRLKKYDIDTKKTYSLSQYEEKGFTAPLFLQTCKESFSKDFELPALPPKVALLTAYIMLKMRQDGLLKNVALLDIQRKTSVRNNSIFTHGHKPLNKTEYLSLEKLVKTLLERYFEIEEKDMGPIAEKLRFFTFPKLDHYSLTCITKKR